MPTYRYCTCCGFDCVSDTEAVEPLCPECREAGCAANESLCDSC
jgi:hypothetical protein